MKNYVKLFWIIGAITISAVQAMNEEETKKDALEDYYSKGIKGFKGNSNKSIINLFSTLIKKKNFVIFEKHIAINWGDIKNHIANKLNNDPNAQGDKNMTLLHYAVWENRFDMVKMLVLKYDVSLNLKDHWERTPLDLALKGKQTITKENDSRRRVKYEYEPNSEMIEFLKDHGAKSNIYEE